LAFDEWENGIPIAFIIVGKAKERDIRPWLQKLNARAKAVKSDWEPRAFVVDNAQAEINAIKYVLLKYYAFKCIYSIVFNNVIINFVQFTNQAYVGDFQESVA
jgi:hypothetical protein